MPVHLVQSYWTSHLYRSSYLFSAELLNITPYLLIGTDQVFWSWQFSAFMITLRTSFSIDKFGRAASAEKSHQQTPQPLSLFLVADRTPLPSFKTEEHDFSIFMQGVHAFFHQKVFFISHCNSFPFAVLLFVFHANVDIGEELFLRKNFSRRKMYHMKQMFTFRERTLFKAHDQKCMSRKKSHMNATFANFVQNCFTYLFCYSQKRGLWT